MSAEADRFEVIVAGGGLAGGTLALALAQAGLRVAVVEAEPVATRTAAAFDGRASAVARANMQAWRTLGVGDGLIARSQPIRRIVVADGPAPGASVAGGAGAVLSFDGRDLGDPASGSSPGDAPLGDEPLGHEPLGWMVENRFARAALAEALEAAGARVLVPASVRRVEVGPAEAAVVLANGETLSAPLVVGADGRGSRVREQAGIGVRGWPYRQKGVVATVALEHDHQGAAMQLFQPGGPLAVLPLTEQRANLVWTERPEAADALLAGPADAFEAQLARRFGDYLGRPRLLGPRHAYPLALQIAERLSAPRIALVGDAAHVVHPIAGQGLNVGLKDAAALAETIVDARAIGEDWGSEAVLGRYARWRRFDAASLVAVTDLFNRAFSADLPGVRALRGAGLRLVNRWAPARRLFVQEATGSLGELPRLLRGQPLA